MLTAVTGINWGDEGKGRVIDLLAENADVVARYQGGNNAGHTVVTEQGKFILNLLPSGILHPDVTCVLGTGIQFCVKVKLPHKTIHWRFPHDKYNTRYEVPSIPDPLR